MPAELTRVYVPFASVTKSTIKGADGKDIEIRLVKGLMTDESLDLDEQKVDFDWAKGAAEKWHTRWGNIREQHSSNAIGKSVELALLEQQRAIDLTGKIVDAGAIVKTDERILQGWSVGIKGARVIKDATAPNGRIVGGEIVEVSLVDHPANENCKVALVKSAKNGKLSDADQSVIEKLAEADEEKLAEAGTEKGYTPDSHGHLHTHNAGTDQEYAHDHGHDHVGGLHADGKAADHQHDHYSKAIEPDATKAMGPDQGACPDHSCSCGNCGPSCIGTCCEKCTMAESDGDADDAKLTSPDWKAIQGELTKVVAGAMEGLLAKHGIAPASTTTKETTPVEPKIETIPPAAATEPAVETAAVVDKAVVPDTLKATISEYVSKAVETALTSLKEQVEKVAKDGTEMTKQLEELRKRAAPGGPMLGGSKLLGAPEEVLSAVLKSRIDLDLVRKMAEEHPDGQVRAGAREILAEHEKNA